MTALVAVPVEAAAAFLLKLAEGVPLVAALVLLLEAGVLELVHLFL